MHVSVAGTPEVKICEEEKKKKKFPLILAVSKNFLYSSRLARWRVKKKLICRLGSTFHFFAGCGSPARARSYPHAHSATFQPPTGYSISLDSWARAVGHAHEEGSTASSSSSSKRSQAPRQWLPPSRGQRSGSHIL
ncbi:hypothetical protein CAAN1_11S04896 [[Candida] anglica]|uniref:Uncharacterized protein n=1 Tax=[Candida] anglica TaxID=148631 RepID=A0ABP0EJX1_9ASCO